MSEERSEKRFETRPNWAFCFKPRNPRSEHAADYTGITVIDGRKFWVNCYMKTDRNGNPFVSVNVKPVDQTPASDAEPKPKPVRRNERHGRWIP